MKLVGEETVPDCQRCANGKANEGSVEIAFSMAFQPIIDFHVQAIFGYEALARGPHQESAAFVLSQVDEHNRYGFDQACRLKAIRLAHQLGLEGILSINFLPKAVHDPKNCIKPTLDACASLGFPTSKLMFEVAEHEQLRDGHVKRIFTDYKAFGFVTAFDDFGAGYSNLNQLADFQPDLLKLDMALIRHIDQDPMRRAIVRAIMEICREFSILVVAEGVESEQECQSLLELGVNLFQGYYFAYPAFEALPPVHKTAWNFIVQTNSAKPTSIT